MRLALLTAALLALWLPARAQPLNDTGQAQCYDGDGAPAACDSTALPGQDGRYGRDAAQAAGKLPAKTGAGPAGFDFTPLGDSGAALSQPGGHACVRDNVTGLDWSTETLPLQTWDDAQAAAASYGPRCGHATGWRLPTRRELLSIVDFGQEGADALIDTLYFPEAQFSAHWTADVYAPDPGQRWTVYFYSGDSGPTPLVLETEDGNIPWRSYARLVHDR